MAEKIVTIKEVGEKEKGDNKWVECIDVEDKVHRVFRSMQKNDGTWARLEKEVDILKAMECPQAVQVIKEKKGNFWNIIGVELVKDVLVQEAQKKVEDKSEQVRVKSMSLAYAKDLAVANLIEPGKIINWACIFGDYLNGNLEIDDAKLAKLLTQFVAKSKEDKAD